MNIFRHELKQNINSAIIWIIALLAITALYISIFPNISQEMSDVIKGFPEAFKKGLGITEDGFSTFPSLYALVLNLVILSGAVQAMNLGVGIISKEVRGKTADFLLSKPISRFNIITQKFSSGITLLLISNVVFLGAVWGIIGVFIDNPFQFETFVKSSLTLFLIQFFFFALGFFIGVVLPKVKSVIAVSLPIVFGFYVFGLLDTVIGEEKIKYLTPFKYFDAKTIFMEGKYNIFYIVVAFLFVITLIIVSQVAFRKRDLDI